MLSFAPPVISVDVEDWAQSNWDPDLQITQRAATNTRRLLVFLREANVRATMFVLGKFARAFPEVVREIRAEGHEVASHGYGHVAIFRQSPIEFSQDIHRGKDILEQILGERVRGYRAPDFSIVRRTLAALELLANAGFEYDSSIFPIWHRKYGIPDWPVAPVRVSLSGNKSILEVPIGTVRYMGNNWPVGGGGYHRLLPGFLSRHFAEGVMASSPFVFYCHPYEFDTREFKELPIKIPFSFRLHQGLGRRWFGQRLKVFLRQFGGQSMQDLLTSKVWPNFDLVSFMEESEEKPVWQ
jgi:polysaccharide deacetylase family protein (PEP-CTERM system associated)